MAQLQLRPLGVGEIIDASFTLYRKRFGPMISIALLLVFVPFVVSVLGGCTFGEALSTSCTSPIGWIGYVASFIGQFIAPAAAVIVAAGAYADVPADWRSSTLAGLRNIVAIVVATIVAAVAVWIGILLLIVPGIFLAVSFVVYREALMIEGLGPIASLGRSWRLATGERWRLLGAGLALIVISIFAFGIAGVVVYLVLAELVGLSSGDSSYMTQQVLAVLAVPLAAVVGTVFYLDLRVRKDGLDRAELAAELSRVA